MSLSNLSNDFWHFYLRLLKLSLIFLCSLAISGCFKPMYKSLNGELSNELASIQVEPTPDLLGHYLTDELIFELNGSGTPVVPRYRLSVTAKERMQTPIIDSQTGRAASNTIVVDVEYNLRRYSGGETIMSGKVISAVSYDRFSQRFANLRAERDAEIRNAKTIANQIKTRIASTFAASQNGSN